MLAWITCVAKIAENVVCVPMDTDSLWSRWTWRMEFSCAVCYLPMPGTHAFIIQYIFLDMIPYAIRTLVRVLLFTTLASSVQCQLWPHGNMCCWSWRFWFEMSRHPVWIVSLNQVKLFIVVKHENFNLMWIVKEYLCIVCVSIILLKGESSKHERLCLCRLCPPSFPT